MWAVSKEGSVGDEPAKSHGHRACRALEAPVRILAFTLTRRPLEAIEQGGV